METPPGDWVCQLDNSLYGLKDAPMIWYERLTEELKEISFQPLSNAPCVFRRDYVILILYVDDVHIFDKTEDELATVKQDPGSKLPTKDLGEADNFLGGDFETSSNSATLKQSKRITVVLKEARIDNSRLLGCSLDPSIEYSTKDSISANHGFSYRELIGSLLHLSTRTRHDLSAECSVLAKNVTEPCKVH